jgi:membrane associated rhomboid family serine protease
MIFFRHHFIGIYECWRLVCMLPNGFNPIVPRKQTTHSAADASCNQSDAARPRWMDPAVFPLLDMQPQWGIFHARKVEPMPLADIVSRIAAGPGEVLWHGNTAEPAVLMVTRPDNARPVMAAECVELQQAILKRDEEQLLKTRKRNALVFYPLLLFAVFLTAAGSKSAVIFAIFAVSTGGSHIEAWLALTRLRRAPQDYLRKTAAQLRYSAWLGIAGVKHWCRTCWMTGAWVLIGVAQLLVPAASLPDGAPRYLAAALVKSAVLSEPWRLLTATMVHGSIIHLIMNAATMLSLGLLLERGAHRHLLSVVWLLGALSGSLFSWLLLPATSVGASGGILAVFGFLLVMAYRRKQHLPPDFLGTLIRSLLLIAMLGLLAWSAIDNAAHLGGAIAGAAVGYWVFREKCGELPLRDSRSLQIAGRSGDALFVLIVLFTLAKLFGVA